jgi:sugar O-acyltransferase (sialic acid O-acetyltransferase NeuD family)
MKRQIGVYGASGFGREVVPIVRQQLEQSKDQHYELVFVDDKPVRRHLNGHRVLTYEEWLAERVEVRQVVLAIANSVIRESLAARCANEGIGFFNVLAPNAVVLDEVKMGMGSILCPFVTVTSNISIGKQFHANIYSYVAHDCIIGDFVTFAPGVQCNGNVIVEDHVYIGTGAVIRQGNPEAPLVLGRGSVIGMGAVVTKSVPPDTTVVGNPARLMARGS